MSLGILSLSVLVVLSNFVLENVEGQPKDCSTVFPALEKLIRAEVGRYEAKIQLQTTSINNIEAKVEIHDAKADMQARDLKAFFEEKFSNLETVVNNLMAEDQKQAISLHNLNAKVDAQAPLLTNFNASVDKQATWLSELKAGSKFQKNLLNNIANNTEVQGKLLTNLKVKVDEQASSFSNFHNQTNEQRTLLQKLDTSGDMQAASLRNLVAKVERHEPFQAMERLETKLESQTAKLLNTLEAKVEVLDNSFSTLESKVEMQARTLSKMETLLEEVKANVQVQVTALKDLVAREEWQEPIAQPPTNRTTVALVGDDVELFCVVHGTPLPEIRWTRENGTLLESDRAVVGNNGKTLRIKKVQVSDEGTYICVAVNGVGTPASQSVRLEVFGPAEQCHKMIELDTGRLEEGPSSSSCLWVIKLQNTTGFSLELNPQMKESVLVIPQQNPSNIQPIRVTGSKNASQMFGGKSLAIVLPPRRERTTLSWTGLGVDDSRVSSSTKFLNDLGGTLEWESQRDGTGKVFWLFDLELNGELNWTLNTPIAGRDQENPCRDASFSVFQIRPDGNVNEIERTCDDSTGGSLKLEISSQVLVVLHVESKEASRSKLQISWTHPDEPLKKNVDGIVAGTDSHGLFVIPFKPAQTKAVPSGNIYGLTFDWNSRRIYYLKSGVGILRSNLDGSASETLVSDPSSTLYGMTTEPTTGNVYYGNQTSRTIRVCNNDATKCSTIANSSDLNIVHDIAVHRSKGLLFWSIHNLKVVRANLDGSNATVLLQRNVRGLDVDEHEDRLYWALYPGGIGSCDLNGQDIRTLQNLNGYIYDVAIDNDRVYYTDWNTYKIHGISKSGTDSTLVAQLPNIIRNIALFGTQVSKQPWNPCKKTECAHLCVLVTRWTYRCTCPDNQVLNADGKTCTL